MREMLMGLAMLSVLGCQTQPADPVLGSSRGPCLLGFETDGQTWYAIPNRDAPPQGFVGGAYAGKAVLLVISAGRQIDVPLSIGSHDRRLAIPVPYPITSVAMGSCLAYDPPAPIPP